MQELQKNGGNGDHTTSINIVNSLKQGAPLSAVGGTQGGRHANVEILGMAPGDAQEEQPECEVGDRIGGERAGGRHGSVQPPEGGEWGWKGWIRQTKRRRQQKQNRGSLAKLGQTGPN